MYEPAMAMSMTCIVLEVVVLVLLAVFRTLME